MSLVLYAIADPLGDPGQHLREVVEGGLAAIVGDHDGTRLERRGENLWRYERVMEELMDERAIIPARFGSVLTDEPSVCGLLRDRHYELAATLERVRGAVELSVHAGWVEDAATAAPDDGTGYMQARLAQHRRAQEVSELLSPLGALARAGRRRVLPDQSLPVHDAYLVDCDLVEAFTELVHDIDARREEIELICTGPWPPYSFARALDDQRAEVAV